MQRLHERRAKLVKIDQPYSSTLCMYILLNVESDWSAIILFVFFFCRDASGASKTDESPRLGDVMLRNMKQLKVHKLCKTAMLQRQCSAHFYLNLDAIFVGAARSIH